jgi:hypothetical protein
MKRSERYLHQARRCALWASLTITASAAACIWSVALVGDMPSGGMLAAALGVPGVFFSGCLLREAARLLRLAGKESRWEYEREIRPRI